MLNLRPQEIAFDDPDSHYRFEPSPRKPFLATPGALDHFGLEAIVGCLRELQAKAREHAGIDYLQVFEDDATGDRLWFIEDGPGGAITALLPSEH